MPTIADFLRLESASRIADREASALLVGLLLSKPGKEERFKAIAKRVAEDGDITSSWLVSVVPGCKSVGDLEEQWDRWMWKQRHIVYEPGELYPEHVERLKAALLIYPEVSGIPVEDRGERPLYPRDLIALKNRRALAETARTTSERLRALALGRGDELREVANAYCSFFEALPVTRRRSRLEELLDEAEDKLEKLERQLEARGSEAGLTTEPDTRKDE